jgi:hypothetical protein
MFSRIIYLRKKGLSQVVSGLILVLLGVIAVSLFSVYVFKVVSTPSFAPEFSCLDLKIGGKISFDRTCYNSETGDIELNVKRLGDGLEFDRMYFILDMLGKPSRKYCCGVDCIGCNVLDDGSSSKYYLSGSEEDVGGNVILEFFGCNVDEKIIESCN